MEIVKQSSFEYIISKANWSILGEEFNSDRVYNPKTFGEPV